MSTEAMKQALEALKHGVREMNMQGLALPCMPLHEAITSLRQAIADLEKQEHGSPEDMYVGMHKHLNCPHCGGSGHIDDVADKQEPVAWMQADEAHISLWKDDYHTIPLYTHPQPKREHLTVRLISFPETNGKTNWTAMFVRTRPWDGLTSNSGGITIDRGEFWNRVAYNAERARFLLGERATEPSIMAYCKDIRTPEEWDGTDNESHQGIKEKA